MKVRCPKCGLRWKDVRADDFQDGGVPAVLCQDCDDDNTVAGNAFFSGMDRAETNTYKADLELTRSETRIRRRKLVLV
jgi:hypothetical protein